MRLAVENVQYEGSEYASSANQRAKVLLRYLGLGHKANKEIWPAAEHEFVFTGRCIIKGWLPSEVAICNMLTLASFAHSYQIRLTP